MIFSRALFAASVFLTATLASYNEQQKMVDDVNKYRTAGGVPRLTMSESAQAHAQYQASIQQMTHDDPVPFMQRFTNQGFQATKAAENVADTTSMDTLFASKILYDDPPHQANIMNPEYSHFGSGAAQGANGRWYWCQHFGYASGEPTDGGASAPAPASAPTAPQTAPAQPAAQPAAAPAQAAPVAPVQPAAPAPAAPQAAAARPVAPATPVAPGAPVQPAAPAPVQAPIAAPSPLEGVQNLIGGFQVPPQTPAIVVLPPKDPQPPVINVLPPKDLQPPVINVLAPKTLPPPPPCTGGECSLFKDLPSVFAPPVYPLPLSAYPDSFARPVLVQPVAAVPVA